MARTVLESFRKFKSNLEITSLQKSTVSTRQKNIRSAVEKELKVLDSFLTGSYSRHTMIAPLKKADIDIFTVLSSSYYQKDGQANLLDRLKRVLKKTYPKTPHISRNKQAITINFSDFKVDVIPAFNRRGGGYLIPSTAGNIWIPTDPKKHVNIISKANISHNGDFVPLIKMFKAWNMNINRFFNSFHLEVLALEILNNVRISSYPSGIRYLFDHGRSLISKKNLDPAGYGGDVGYYLDTPEKINSATNKFTTAYKRALKAENYNKEEDVDSAIVEWKKIFGDYFPSYG